MKAIFVHELRSSFRSLSAWVFASFLPAVLRGHRRHDVQHPGGGQQF